MAGPNAVPRSDEVSGEKDGLHEWSIRFDEHVSGPYSANVLATTVNIPTFCHHSWCMYSGLPGVY